MTEICENCGGRFGTENGKIVEHTCISRDRPWTHKEYVEKWKTQAKFVLKNSEKNKPEGMEFDEFTNFVDEVSTDVKAILEISTDHLTQEDKNRLYLIIASEIVSLVNNK